ncbi:MAG: hypothetical protein V3W08_01205 [Candidatus Binatia bacterium]
MRRPSPKLTLLLIGALLAGCTQTKAFLKSESFEPRPGVTVLLMPPDIELFELTAGGVLEPKADWTATARLYVTAALAKELGTKNVHMIQYEPPIDMPSKDYAYNQFLKLHEAVGGAIFIHKYTPRFELPTKKDKLDWSLGQDVGALREDNDAQYGLFIHLRDSYSSGGRVAFMVLAAILTMGRYVPHGGAQLGFASLVDLESGDILWFNRLARGTGDLRTPESAQEAVRELLSDLPL